MSEEFIKLMRVIPAGKRKVSKRGDNYLIYLPRNQSHIWKALNEKEVKVEVYLVIPKEGD